MQSNRSLLATQTTAEEWQWATEEEHPSLLLNNTFVLIPCPHRANVIKTRWVYKVKVNAVEAPEDSEKTWEVSRQVREVSQGEW
jgi:hypothetical protein